MDDAHNANPNVALVEDESVLREEIAFQLRHFDLAVQTFDSAVAFYRKAAVTNFDVAILDIGLETEDGLTICRHLRSHGSTMGIVFVSARAMRDDRISGLAVGADAYLVKPIDIEELALIVRRLALRSTRPSSRQGAESEIGRTANRTIWCLQRETLSLTTPNGAKIQLTPVEARLIGVLDNCCGSICTYAEIFSAIAGPLEKVDKHRIEVIVSRLRTKVLRESSLNLPVRAERGVGYRYSPA
jgi:DNA-binding response OmpR family regulator